MAQSKDTGADAHVIVIKKYANRRLYDTTKSSYVTLEDLSRMVRDGDEFVVRDAKSGEDITRSVLAQIIFEAESKGQNMLPINFLRQLISLYGDTLQGFVPGYLDASMETFTRNQEKIREQLGAGFAAGPAIAGIEALTRTNMELFEKTIRMLSPFGPQMMRGKPEQKPKDEAAAASPDKAASDVDLAALKAQLAEMQQQLSRLVKDT